LTAAAAGHGHDGAAAGSDEGTEAGTDTTARWLGGIGLVLGALGLGLGGGALLRSRRGSAQAAPEKEKVDA
jgi:hypothetical protein